MEKSDGIVPFKKYVVCSRCCTLYNFEDCLTANRKSKSCSFCKYPCHPHALQRQLCGSILLKTVETSSGKTFLYPHLTYCYLSIKESIQMLLNRPNFLHQCEEWRKRTKSPGMLRDIYDGAVWQEFMSFDGQPFLSEEGNLALMMNMDFFQPFKHVQYSLGAIYLTVLNLPRDVRNKRENMILVGLIPGPHEPKHDINSFLKPFVDELLMFWNGVTLCTNLKGRIKIRCALLSVECDLPAGRKVCGFLGHSATLGCSRCLKAFTGSVGSIDYSGFDRQNWQHRTGYGHRQASAALLKHNTKSSLQKAESESG